MSGGAILFRSDAQCVTENKLVSDLAVSLSLSLSVSILIYLSPSLPLKILNIFYHPSSLPGRPSPLGLPLPHFRYPLPFPFSMSLYTPLHPYFHPPVLFTPPVMVIKPQVDTVMGICTFDKKNVCYSRQPCFVRR